MGDLYALLACYSDMVTLHYWYVVVDFDMVTLHYWYVVVDSDMATLDSWYAAVDSDTVTLDFVLHWVDVHQHICCQTC